MNPFADFTFRLKLKSLQDVADILDNIRVKSICALTNLHNWKQEIIKI